MSWSRRFEFVNVGSGTVLGMYAPNGSHECGMASCGGVWI